MERDDLVFKAKLAEQAERYVFCALLRVARWFLRVDFELDDFDSRFHFFSFTERQKVNSFNDFSSRCGVWRAFDFVFESEKRETRTGRGVRECIFAREK